MTKFEDIKNNLAAGAKVVVGLHTFNGAKDLAKFEETFSDLNYLKYSQTRIYEKGMRYSTHLLAAH